MAVPRHPGIHHEGLARPRAGNRASPALAINLSYDAEGRLRVVRPAGVATSRLYDGQDLVAEYNSSSTRTARHVHGPGIVEPLVSYTGAGVATKHWLYADHLGSIVAQANASGTNTGVNRYGPFGEPSTTSGGADARGKLTSYACTDLSRRMVATSWATAQRPTATA